MPAVLERGGALDVHIGARNHVHVGSIEGLPARTQGMQTMHGWDSPTGFMQAALKGAQGMQMMRAGVGQVRRVRVLLQQKVWDYTVALWEGAYGAPNLYGDLPVLVSEGWPLHEQELVGACNGTKRQGGLSGESAAGRLVQKPGERTEAEAGWEGP